MTARCADVSPNSVLGRFGGISGMLILAVVFGGGCAASRHAAQRSAPIPDDPGRARVQLSELERRIRRHRLALRLPSRASNEGDDSVSSAGGAVAPAARPPAPQPTKAPMRARTTDAAPPIARKSAPSPPSHSAPDSVAAGRRASKQSYSRSPRCPMPCRHTRAICHAAGRICRVAQFLADSDSRHRCERARKDCRQAREATAGRCSARCR